MPVSIDEAIAKLARMKKLSRLGGNTALVLCLVDSGLEYVEVDDIALEQDVDGATATVRVTHPDLSGSEEFAKTYWTAEEIYDAVAGRYVGKDGDPVELTDDEIREFFEKFGDRIRAAGAEPIQNATETYLYGWLKEKGKIR